MALQSASVSMNLSFVDKPDLGLGVPDPAVTRLISNLNLSPAPGDPTPTDVGWHGTITLAAGTFTLDLTALSNGNMPDIDLTGKKIHHFQIEPAAANSDLVTVAGAAADPYELFGDAAGQITLGAGRRAQLDVNGSSAAVSGTVKSITFTSSDVDAIVKMVIVAGD